MNLIFNKYCYYNKNQLVTKGTQKKPFSELNLTNNKKVELDNVLFLYNTWDKNFRHYMIETFILLSYIFNKNFKPNKFKIMVVKPIKNYQIQTLEILDLTKYIIYHEENVVYNIKNLIWSHKITFKNKNNENYKMLLSTLINNSKKISKVKQYDMIYLSREHADGPNRIHRYIINQNEVSQIFNKYGYIKMRIDNLDFWDQISIINNAKKVITIIGANCENISFANNNCKFSIIYAENQLSWINWYYCNSLHKISCSRKISTLGLKDQLNGAYKVDIELLEKKLNKQNINAHFKKMTMPFNKSSSNILYKRKMW